MKEQLKQAVTIHVNYFKSTILVIMVALVVVSCESSGFGGIDIDFSEPIYLLAETESPLASLPDLTAAERTAALSWFQPLAGQGTITVGYQHQPSWDNTPWYESDFAVYWSTSPEQVYLHQSTVAINGEQAVFDETLAEAHNDLTAFHCRAEFSVASVQAALDQQYSRGNRYFYHHVAVSQRRRVPVHWQVEGTINGQGFAVEYDELAYVTKWSTK